MEDELVGILVDLRKLTTTRGDNVDRRLQRLGDALEYVPCGADAAIARVGRFAGLPPFGHDPEGIADVLHVCPMPDGGGVSRDHDPVISVDAVDPVVMMGKNAEAVRVDTRR